MNSCRAISSHDEMTVDYKVFAIVIFCLTLILFLCAVILLGIAIQVKLEEANDTRSEQLDCGEEEQLSSIRSGNPLDESDLVLRSDL